MASMFSSLPSTFSERILCYYVNSTSQLQKARVSNIPNWDFERVVFPNQRLLFEATPHALLEIHLCSMAGETLLKQIPCDRLQVYENAGLCLTNYPDPSEHSIRTELVKE